MMIVKEKKLFVWIALENVPHKQQGRPTQPEGMAAQQATIANTMEVFAV
jgi:hypothetical protein